MDFTGKTCLITGANSGLGFATAQGFADQGGETVLLCRSREKGEMAMQKIKDKTPAAVVDYLVCDLASMESVHGFLDEFRRKYSKLDILYNNAAVMKQKRTTTEDGFEMMFQVNFLAPFVITNQLLDQLRKGSKPCIINSTGPADKYRLDFGDLQFEKKYSMYDSFFETKLCLLFASLELARSPKSDGISVMMVIPSRPFKSDITREVPLMGLMKNLFSSSVENAAENILYHMRPYQVDNKNGKVFIGKDEKELTEYWKDKDIGKRLWSVTESMIDFSSVSHE